MKKLLILFIALTVIACKKETPVDYALLSGKISNKAQGEVTLNSISNRSFKETIEIAENGSFADTLRVKEGNYVLYDGTNPAFIYIKNGDNLVVNYDAEDFKNSLAITGKGSEISNYLLKKSETQAAILGPDFYKLDEPAYKAKLEELETAHINTLDSIKGISEDYKAKEKRNIKYFALNRLNDYQPAHAHYTKNIAFKASEGFLDELDDLDYTNEEDYVFSINYKSLVSNHYRKSASELTKKDSTLNNDEAFVKVIKETPETIKNGLLFNKASNGITYAEDLEAYYKLFMDNSSNDEHKETITKSYNKLKAVAKGRPSPKFVNYENYKGGTTSLDDLKGKYVYVDIWATWCGPCKAEIPSLKKIEKQYHGKNIEFVSISVDKVKDHDKWKAMVADKELGGIQLFADKDWSSDFVKGYLIQGIPRFILIDTEGNIINANAPRPSDSKLVDLFNEYKI